MFENSMFYEYFEIYFTEYSRDMFKIKNEAYLSEIIRLSEISPLTRTEVLIEHRTQFYYLPLYWCDDVVVQSALRANASRNYTLSPLEVHPGILARDTVTENPLPENLLELVKAYLLP